MSKGYTIQSFINIISGTTNTALLNNGVYNVVAPRFGANSVKAEALDNFLGANTLAIVNGKGKFGTLGKTARGRLLKALRNRQTLGTVLV